MAQLVVVDGPCSGLILTLDPPERILGRDPRAGLLVPDTAISRRHCRLVVGPHGRWKIVDLGSSNATYLNGEQIKERTLADGDVVRVGESTLRFTESDAGQITARRGRPAALKVNGNVSLGSGPSPRWRASSLDALLALSRDCVALHHPGELLELLAGWIQQQLRASRVTTYRRFGDFLRPLGADAASERGAGAAALRGSAAWGDVMMSGSTVLLQTGELFTPIGDAPSVYVMAVERRAEQFAESDLRLVANATRLAGAELAAAERVESLERAAAEARMAVDDVPDLIANSNAMKSVVAFIDRVATTEANVFIAGERGTGKKLVAHTIHERSSRRHEPFIVLDCGSVTEPQLEAALFASGTPTLFEQAGRGTLFLERIGILDGRSQARLSGILTGRVAARIMTSDERALQQTGKDAFRKDLYQIIAREKITAPPLRHRDGDIIPLACQIMARRAYSGAFRPTGFDADACVLLGDHAWPGNVSELRNTIDHALAMATGNLVGVDDLPSYLRDTRGNIEETSRLPRSSAVIEQSTVEAAFQSAGGDMSKAARILGMDRAALYEKLRLYGLV